MSTATASPRSPRASTAFLRDADVCELFGITRTTLRRWIEQGEPLPDAIRIGGKRYWPRAAVERFIGGNTDPATDAQPGAVASQNGRSPEGRYSLGASICPRAGSTRTGVLERPDLEEPEAVRASNSTSRDPA